MAYPHPFWHTPHTFRAPNGSSTEGPCGTVGMAYSHPIRHTPQTLHGSTGNSGAGPSGTVRMAAP
eukprot:4996218-Pyramimonas_sp.AAC.1